MEALSCRNSSPILTVFHLVQGRHRRPNLRDQEIHRVGVYRRVRARGLQRHRIICSENGVLNERGGFGSEDGAILPWTVRLRIAKEVAIAVTYLHTAFPRIIIHRDIKPMNVFLDKNWTAKLTGFTFSVSLPEGKSWIKDKVMGTFGYIDPVYFSRGLVTEYTDVFSFGIFMLVLLMGRPAVFAGSSGVYCNILDYVKGLQERGETVEFGHGSNDMRLGQLKMFLELALRCCEKRDEDRPKMISVSKEIKLIEQASLACSQDGQT